MKQDEKTGKVTTTIQEVAYYNMFLTEAILELLAEKGSKRPAEDERNPDRRGGVGARQEAEERISRSVSLDALKTKWKRVNACDAHTDCSFSGSYSAHPCGESFAVPGNALHGSCYVSHRHS